MNIIFQILKKDYVHSVSEEKEARRRVKGDLINVYDYFTEEPNPNTNLAFIVVLNIPSSSLPKHLVTSYSDGYGSVIQRADWFFDLDMLEIQDATTFDQMSMLTFEWLEFKAYFKKKSEESRAITEGDL